MNHYQRLIKAVADLQRQMANLVRYGAVHEVKGDKIRINLGKNHLGDDILSPWLNTVDLRGGARVRRFYKKGQNIAMLAPNGDIRQGMLFPFAPNKNFLRPDHANKSGQDEEVYQLEDLRVRKTKQGYSIWLQKPKEQQQQGHVQKLPDPESDAGGEADMIIRLNKEGGITARIGKLLRFAVNEKGVKMKANQDFVVVIDGKIVMSREPIYAKDPIPDDDEV